MDDAPPFSIATRLQAGKNSETDWLAEDTSPSVIAEILVSMANTRGGWLLIGIKHKTLTGVKALEETIDRVIQAALSITPALIIPLPRAIEEGGATLVVTHVPAGLPHVYATSDGKYLARQDAERVPLPPRALRRLMIERSEILFESDCVARSTPDDLHWERVREYVKQLGGLGGNSEESTLIRRGCLALDGQVLRPTYAGMLLFGKEPQLWLKSADISAVRFAGDMMSDVFTRQDIGGTLPEQIRKTEAFLKDYLRKEVRLTGKMARDERYEYPMEAARELVMNAIAHRDYAIVGDNIRLFVFSNRLEVHSPGGLAGYMTVENLKEQRFSRNPTIVQVLSDLHFIERLGYGVDRVIELMRHQKLREPVFKDYNGTFIATLYNQKASLVDRNTPREEIKPRTSLFLGAEINPRQEAALEFLTQNPERRITNSDLSQIFPEIHAETIRRDLVDLVAKDILVKMGKKRGSYYMLKRDSDMAESE